MNDILGISVQHQFPSGFCVDFQLELPLHPHTVTAIAGISGSGKSTLLRILAGLQSVQRGSIRLGEELWLDTSRRFEFPPQARRVGMVFQHPALFPHLTVARNILLGIARWPGSQRTDRLAHMLSEFDLHHLQARLPGQLSGGQMQRVALARSIAPQPRLLLLDEPLSSLDLPSRQHIRQILRRLLVSWPCNTLLVTHEPAEIQDLATRVVVIDEGRILQVGPLGHLLQNPLNERVAQLLDCDRTVRRNR